MSGQYFSDFLDRLDDGVTEFLVPKMRAHSIDEALPEFFAAFFVNGLIADHGKPMRARRDQNEHGVAVRCFVHPEPMKFLLRGGQRIDNQLSTLNINANLTGRFCFRLPNRVHDAVMLELAEKFLRTHGSPTSTGTSTTSNPAAA
jgi:hypothetical protein